EAFCPLMVQTAARRTTLSGARLFRVQPNWQEGTKAMPVEFIGMIGTRDQSESRPARGTGIDSDYLLRFAPGDEADGFGRVLIGFSSSQPDGLQVAAYAASQTERLSFLVAHRPGFVAPTVAARAFATLDTLVGGRIAVHIITGGSDGEQRRDGD